MKMNAKILTLLISTTLLAANCSGTTIQNLLNAFDDTAKASRPKKPESCTTTVSVPGIDEPLQMCYQVTDPNGNFEQACSSNVDPTIDLNQDGIADGTNSGNWTDEECSPTDTIGSCSYTDTNGDIVLFYYGEDFPLDLAKQICTDKGGTFTQNNDSDGSLSASAVIDESAVFLPSTSNSPADRVNLFDFVISDGGSSDNLSLDITSVRIHVDASSSGDPSEPTWILSTEDTSLLSGSFGVYNSTSRTITFSGLGVSVPDAGNVRFILSAFAPTNPVNTIDGNTFILSIDGDDDVGVESTGTTMGDTTAVNNGSSGQQYQVTATRLVYSTPPPNSVTSLTDFPLTNGVALAVSAVDANDNLDLDYSDAITISSYTDDSCTSVTAQPLSSADTGGLVKNADAGIASWQQLQSDLLITTTTVTYIKAEASFSVCSSIATNVNPAGLKEVTVAPGSAVIEPVAISSIANDAGSAVAVFDFSVTDAGGDALSAAITDVVINLAGTVNSNDISFLLDGPGFSAQPGVINAGVIEWLNLDALGGGAGVVADSNSGVFTVSAYVSATPVGTFDNDTILLDFTPNINIGIDLNGSQMVDSQAPLSNGSGSLFDVTATRFAWGNQPVDGFINTDIAGSISAIAVDVNGNTDVDFSDNVVVSNYDITCTTDLASLGSSEGTTKAATSGTIAWFNTVPTSSGNMRLGLTSPSAAITTPYCSNTINIVGPSNEVTITAASSGSDIIEPVAIPSDKSAVVDRVAVLDFNLVDGGSDTVGTVINTVEAYVSGTADPADYNYYLNLPDGISYITGTFLTGPDRISFGGLTLNLNDGESLRFEIAVTNKAALSTTTEGQTLILSMDESTIGVTSSGSQMSAPDSAFDINNGTGSAFSVVASELTFATQPPLGATKNADWPGDLVIRATDADGNTDTDYNASLTLTAYTDSACTTPAGGILTSVDSGGLTKAAAAGVVTWNDLRYDTTASIYIGAADGSLSGCSNAISIGDGDTSGTVTAAAGVNEALGLSVPSTANSSGAAVALFDFTVSDGGGGDTLPLDVIEFQVNISGSGNASDFTWLLNGGALVDLPGYYSGGTIYWGLGSCSDTWYTKADCEGNGEVWTPAAAESTAEGASTVYTVSAYASASPAGTLDNNTFSFSIDGDTNIIVDSAGSTMTGTNTAVNTAGSEFTYTVTADRLSMSNLPASFPINTDPAGSVTVSGTDVNGNIDTDYSETLTLAAYTNSTCTIPAGGSLNTADAGGLSKTTTSGSAGWSDTRYNTPQNPFYLGAADTGSFSVCSNAASVFVNSDGQISAAGAVTEPVALPSTATTAGSRVALFDFTISDAGSGDGLPLAVTSLTVNIGGSGDPSDLTLYLNGPDVSNVSISGAAAATWNSPGISVADGMSEVYTVSAYISSSPGGTTDNETFTFSISGDSDVTVSAAGTQMNSPAAVTAGSGTVYQVTASRFTFTAGPPASGFFNTDFSGPLALAATDNFGNIDSDYTGNVSLAAYTNAVCSSAAGGTLSSAETLTKTAAAGSASWTDTRYNTAGSIYIGAGDGSISGCSTVVSVAAGDNDADLTASATVSEPVSVASTVNSAGAAVDVFDFTISDGATSDPFGVEISAIDINVSGTADPADAVFILDGPGVTSVTGSYAGGVITFSSLASTVSSGSSGTYTLSMYFSSSPGATTDNETFIFSVDGSTDVTVNNLLTTFGTTSAVTNGSGTAFDVTASDISFTTQPPASSPVSTDFSGSLAVSAVDANGNIDADYTAAVTLAAYTDASCTSAAGGSLASSDTGGLTRSASAGSASWINTTYNAVLNPLYIGASSGGFTSCSSAVSVFVDSDADITSAAGVSEPVNLPSTANSFVTRVALFDFTISDGGTSDGLPLNISDITVTIGGSGDPADVSFYLNGPDVTNKVMDSGGSTVSWNSLAIEVANGGSEVYTISAYITASPSGTADNNTFTFSIDGDVQVTAAASGTQFTSTTPVSAASTYTVTTTQLSFNSGVPGSSYINTDFTGSLNLAGSDANGNTDTDYTAAVTLSAWSSSDCSTTAAGGNLSSTDGGGLSKAASTGLVSWTDLRYDTAGTIYIGAGDGSLSGCSSAVSMNGPDSDGDLTAAGGVIEPVAVSSLADTPGEAINVFDFTISDGGTADPFGMEITGININVSGSGNPDDAVFILNGPGVSSLTGSYAGGVITFSGLSSGITAGGSGTYTLSMYFSSTPSSTTDNQTFIFSVDGDTDVTANADLSTIGAGTSAVDNGSGSAFTVSSTGLAFTTPPAAGAPINTDLAGNVEVSGVDANGNIDADYSGTVTLSAHSNISCSAAAGGSLSSADAGGLSQTTSGGTAVWNDLKHDTVEVIYLQGDDTSNSVCSGAVTISNGSQSGELVAGGLAEPASLSSLVDSAGERTNVFDFTIRESADADSNNLEITEIRISTAGSTGSPADVTWQLTGPDGTYNGSWSAGVITFDTSATPVTIADNDTTGETYTVNAFFASSPSGTTDNESFRLSIDGDTALSVSASSSQMSGANSAVTNGSGFSFDVTATAYSYGSVPTSAYINEDMTGGSSLTIAAVDANGNIDSNYTSAVTLSAWLSADCFSSAASGSLSSADAGGLTHSASGGNAGWNDLKHNMPEPIYIGSGDGSISGCSSTAVTINAPLNEVNLTASATVSEPVAVASTVNSAGAAVDVFDFTISDGGADPFGAEISALSIAVSGSADPSDAVFILDGPGISGVTGSYAAGFVSWSGLSSTVASGGSSTYTVSLYYSASPSSTADNQTIILTIDGDLNVTLLGTQSQMSVTSAVNNGSGTTFEVTSSGLAFTAGPPASAYIGTDWSGVLSAAAVDANGNVDTDYNSAITLAAYTDSGCTSASAGTLASADAGGLTKTASGGVASWSDTTHDTAQTIYVQADDSSNTACSSGITINPGTNSGELAAGALSEPAAVASTVDTDGEKTAVFDFIIREGSADADSNNLVVNEVRISTAGSSGDPAEVTWELNGSDGTWTGSYAGGVITFSTAISIADNDTTGETYTVNAYYDTNPSNTTDNDSFTLSIDGDLDLTLDAVSSNMTGTNTAVNNSSGFSYTVTAAALSFSGTPASGSVNTDLTGGGSLTVYGVDENGNADADYSSSVSLNGYTDSTCSSIAPGSLSSADAGGLSQTASAGSAVWNDIKYNREADSTPNGLYIEAADGSISGCSGEILVNDNVAPGITSAETLDLDNDGEIDHYRITFDEPVDDSSFPNYVDTSTEGGNTLNWTVGAYSNVRIDPTVAADVDDDAVIYLKFDQSGTPDTGAKPDVYTSATPGLTDGATAPANNLAQVFTGSVTEVDTAAPVLLSASGVSNTTASALFSETVTAASAECSGCGAIYTNSPGLTISDSVMDAGAGINDDTVQLTTAAQSAGQAYTLTVAASTVTDLAGSTINTTANTAVWTGQAVALTLNSAASGGNTTVVLTFNVNINTTTTDCASAGACSSIYSINSGSLAVNSASGSGNTVTLTTASMTSDTVNGYTVTASGIQSVDSASCTLPCQAAYTGDILPDLLSAVSVDQTTVDVVFSEDMQWNALADGGALNTSNYCIEIQGSGNCPGSPDLSISAAVSQTAQTTVRLTTSAQAGGTTYTIYVADGSGGNSVNEPNGIKDDTGNNMDAADAANFTGLENIKVVTGAKLTGHDDKFSITFSKAPTTGGGNNAVDNLNNYSFPPGLNTVSFCTNADTVDCPAGGVSGNTVYFKSSTAPSPGVYTVVSATAVNSPTGAQGCILPSGGSSPADCLQSNPNDRAGVVFDLPTNPGEGPVYDDPFGDTVTVSGQVFTYNGKLYIGPNDADSGIFETPFNMQSSATITLDAEGDVNNFPGIQPFDSSIDEHGTVALGGIDDFYAGCYHASLDINSKLSGSECTAAGGQEFLFVVGFITDSAGYRSIWSTTHTTSPFRFLHNTGISNSTAYTYRAMSQVIYKGYVFVVTQHQGYYGPRWSHFQPNVNNANNDNEITSMPDLQGRYMPRIAHGGGTNCGNSSRSDHNGQRCLLLSLDTMYEYDNDDAGSDNSRLYIANGGSCSGTCLTAPERTNATDYDGGIMRSTNTYSTFANVPNLPCSNNGNCDSRWENVTPNHNNWLYAMSIALPEDAQGDGVCGTIGPGTTEDMDCTEPPNTITPALKAIPYMVNFNGDLYVARNACSSTTVQTLTTTVKKTCAAGSEVPQLWKLPDYTENGNAVAGASDWQPIAQSCTANICKTNFSGLNANGANNTELTLLAVNDDRLYVGFDNATNGLNIWRTKAGVTNPTSESDFEPICDTGNACSDPSKQFGLNDSAANTRIFSVTSVNDGGTHYYVFTGGNGTNVVKVYRGTND